MPGARDAAGKPAPDTGRPLEDVRGTPIEDTDTAAGTGPQPTVITKPVTAGFEDTELDALAAESTATGRARENVPSDRVYVDPDVQPSVGTRAGTDPATGTTTDTDTVVDTSPDSKPIGGAAVKYDPDVHPTQPRDEGTPETLLDEQYGLAPGPSKKLGVGPAVEYDPDLYPEQPRGEGTPETLLDEQYGLAPGPSKKLGVGPAVEYDPDLPDEEYLLAKSPVPGGEPETLPDEEYLLAKSPGTEGEPETLPDEEYLLAKSPGTEGEPETLPDEEYLLAKSPGTEGEPETLPDEEYLLAKSPGTEGEPETLPDEEYLLAKSPAPTEEPAEGPAVRVLAPPLPPPGDTILRTREGRPIRPGGPVRLGDEVPPTEDAPEAAARPTGSYPRAIEHQERVEFNYDPETGHVDAKVMDSTEPVVTGWDSSPPERDERAVGTWDVTPTDEGVTVTSDGRVSIPEDIKDRLKAQAEETGEPASTTVTLRYQHDLDTRSTRSEYRGGPAEMAEALREQRPAGELSEKYKLMLENLQRKVEEKQPTARAGRRRSASRRDDLKKPNYSLPQIVVVQEAASPRRFGGL